MECFKCAFHDPLIADEFGCECGQKVTRRAGPDVACQNDAAHQRCAFYLQRLKDVTLPIFDLPDDPLLVPDSLMKKIQYGGLLGLQTELSRDQPITNIFQLMNQAEQTFGEIQSFPYETIKREITNFTLRKRGKKS